MASDKAQYVVVVVESHLLCCWDARSSSTTSSTARSNGWSISSMRADLASILCPGDLWRWTVAVSDIADLSTPAKLTTLGLPTPRPGRRSWNIVIPGVDPVRPPTTYRDPPAPPTGMRT